MKRLFAMVLVALMALSSVAAIAETAPAPASAGVVWYQFSDTFISNARQALETAAQDSGWLDVSSADSKFDVPTQTNNISMFYTKGVDYLCLNNFDTTATTALIEQAKEESTPIVFLNCNAPTDEDLALYEDVWFISSLADQSGTIIGNYVADYWKAHPEADRNGNGKLDYVMLIGVVEHYDSLARRDYSVKAIQDAGIDTNEIYQGICFYSKAEAMNTVQSILAANADDIDAVIAANDDMALGAIEALVGAGFFGESGPYIPVVGVDATAVGLEAIQNGTMLATALNNPVTLGNLAYRLLYCLQSGLEVTKENLDYDASYNIDGHRIWIDYIGIDASNIADAAY